jgi:acyl-CoA dehydrogenase family member 9
MDDQQRKMAEELLFSEVKKQSFGKGLYFGLFDAEKVFPYPRVSEEEKARTDELLSKFKKFADESLDADAIDRSSAIPDVVIQGLAKLGILGMTIPKKYDGQGLSQYAYCKVAEAISARCGATALFVNAHQSIGLKALLLYGTEEQRSRFLSRLARGEDLAAFSLTEPNAGSDASGIETRAVYDPERKKYIINGKKQWTTNGSIAKVLTVMAKTEVETSKGKQDKITAFLVTPDMPGFKITASALEKVGMRGSKTANLEFTNLEVPLENVLGKPGDGLKICLTVLDYGRTTFGATCTGAAKFLVERAVEHAKNRHQFHRPLAAFSLVKKKIASMCALVYAMDATTYLTAGFVDAEVEDFMLESAMLKVFCSDSLWNILYDTMQIFGGRSFFTDQPYERMMRDARLNMIGEGSNEVMAAFIGAVGMRDVGVSLKEVVDAIQNPFRDYTTLLKFGQKSIDRLRLPKVPVRSSLLQKEARDLSQVVRSFGFAVVQVLSRYREEIIEKQLVLDHIATSAIAIFTMTAVLSKLDSDLAFVKDNPKALGNDVPIAKMYCSMAMAKIKTSLENLFDPQDMDFETVSDLITGIKSI